jgi:uncharacterized protein (TIGR02679 family)
VSDAVRGAGLYGGPEYARLLAAARRSLERTGGRLDGRIGVTDPDEVERRAIIGITGIHQPAGTRRLSVPLAVLDAALGRATGSGLAAVLTELGGPLRDRPAEVASLELARGELLAVAEGSPLLSCPWYRGWLDELVADGTVTRLARLGEVASLRHAIGVLEYLEDWPAGAVPVALPALAARVTGDTKALNPGSGVATLVLRALALRAGTGRPASAAERRELWDASHVIVDDLASRVLVLNLPAAGAGLGEWLTGAARYGTPFQVTLHQLVSHPIRLAHRQVFVCENPAVLRRACEELGSDCPPLVCAEGRPSTAFRHLGRAVVSGGGQLRYHGDFDWPGVAIAADVIERHQARPWLMSAEDYRLGAQAADNYVALFGEPGPTPWDPELSAAMAVAGRAVYEEAVADSLLADLRRG